MGKRIREIFVVIIKQVGIPGTKGEVFVIRKTHWYIPESEPTKPGFQINILTTRLSEVTTIPYIFILITIKIYKTLFTYKLYSFASYHINKEKKVVLPNLLGYLSREGKEGNFRQNEVRLLVIKI